jgi:hypothetical protein
MLIASYLLGYDDIDNVCHLAVDNILPDAKQGFDFTLYPRKSATGPDLVDLVLLFGENNDAHKLICLPNIPASVVEHLHAGEPLQIIDFAYGRVIRLKMAAPLLQQQCA